MYTTEHPILVERESVTVEGPSPDPMGLSPATAPASPSEQSGPVTAVARTRDETGHCWDGRPCDHAEHGPAGGPIHLIR